MTNKNAIIIGAGLTGLSTAFYLKKAGWQVKILERDQRIGGSIFTHREDGFVFESGPNTGILSNPDVLDLLGHLHDEINVEPLGDCGARRLVWRNYRWHTLPLYLGESLRTPLLRWTEKLRLLMGSLINRKSITDQLVQNRDLRKDYTVDPFIHAIYSGDFHGLLTKKSDKNLYTTRKGNNLSEKARNKTDQPLLFINGGLDNLVHALVDKIGASCFQLGIDQLEIFPKEDKYAVSYLYNGNLIKDETSVVISTIGSVGLGKIFPFLNAREKELISNLSHINVVQVVVGFYKWRGIPIKALGGLVPPNENRNILGVLFPSSFLKGRAPAKGALLSVFLGGIHHPNTVDLPDENIEKMVMDELRCMLLIPDEKPNLFRIYRHHYAFPQYNDGAELRASTISTIENQFPGLILAGKMRDGVGMSQRIEQGANIARGLIQQFEAI
jgi:oxygen-dependent protoporphyrinogen oxidase